MSYFRDTDHLYKVLRALFTGVRDEEAIARYRSRRVGGSLLEDYRLHMA